MKATGVVRRIDDLGRVIVIRKKHININSLYLFILQDRKSVV